MNRVCKVLGTPSQNDWPDGYKQAEKMKYKFPDFVKVPINYFTCFSLTLLHRNTFQLIKNKFINCFCSLFRQTTMPINLISGHMGTRKFGLSTICFVFYRFLAFDKKERIHKTRTMILLHYLQCPCACTMFF